MHRAGEEYILQCLFPPIFLYCVYACPVRDVWRALQCLSVVHFAYALRFPCSDGVILNQMEISMSLWPKDTLVARQPVVSLAKLLPPATKMAAAFLDT
jgi:hypothetical protein